MANKGIKRFLKIEDYVQFRKGQYTKERVMVGYGCPPFVTKFHQTVEITEFVMKETGAMRDDLRIIRISSCDSARYAGSFLIWVSVKADAVRQNFADYNNLYC